MSKYKVYIYSFVEKGRKGIDIYVENRIKIQRYSQSYYFMQKQGNPPFINREFPCLFYCEQRLLWEIYFNGVPLINFHKS